MRNQRGQVALIVLLVSTVVLTLGMSISRQAVVDTKIEIDEELVKRAFNAAESGIERYLATGLTNYDLPDDSRAEISVDNIGGTTTIGGEELTLANDQAYFWLVDHNADGSLGTNYYSPTSLTITTASGFNGLLRVDYFYRTGAGLFRVRRGYYDFGSSSGVARAGFTSVAGDSVTWNTEEDPLLLVVSPIEESTRISISGTSSFPVQGEQITSVGRAGNTEANTGAATSQVSIVNTYQVPSFLLDAVSSNNSILSN